MQWHPLSESCADRRPKSFLRGRRLPSNNNLVNFDERKRQALNPDEPGIDEATRRRRQGLVKLTQMSIAELRQLAISAGIWDEDGNLTEHYVGDEPSAHRPTD